MDRNSRRRRRDRCAPRKDRRWRRVGCGVGRRASCGRARTAGPIRPTAARRSRRSTSALIRAAVGPAGKARSVPTPISSACSGTVTRGASSRSRPGSRSGEWRQAADVGRVDTGPDQGTKDAAAAATRTRRTLTEPVWVGKDVTGVRVRLDGGSVQDVKLHAVDSTLGKKPETQRRIRAGRLDVAQRRSAAPAADHDAVVLQQGRRTRPRSGCGGLATSRSRSSCAGGACWRSRRRGRARACAPTKTAAIPAAADPGAIVAGRAGAVTSRWARAQAGPRYAVRGHGDRPPHGEQQRLRAGRQRRDAPRDLGLPRANARVLRHRVQLPDRQLRHARSRADWAGSTSRSSAPIRSAQTPARRGSRCWGRSARSPRRVVRSAPWITSSGGSSGCMVRPVRRPRGRHLGHRDTSSTECPGDALVQLRCRTPATL